MGSQIETQHQWVDKLESLSPAVKELNIKRKVDYYYVETVDGIGTYNDKDAFIFANSNLNDELIASSIADLRARSGDAPVRNLLGELTFRKTYGAFSEMAAYDWLRQAGVEFSPQTRLDAAHVVNPNGSILDGQMTLAGKHVYFDIKGFGFLEHKLSILKEKLEEKFVGKEVLVQGGFHVSIDYIQELLERAGFEALVDEIQRNAVARRDSLQFNLREKRSVSISISESDPIKMAAENREYALRFCGQYARNEPFMLLFVIHPWFSKGKLHQNFCGYTDRFCREFSRLAFHSFSDDTSLLEGMQKRQLTKLLAGIGFINAWTEKSSKGRGPSSRIFLNPNALNRLVQADFASIQHHFGNDVTISDA